jgi:hypothetical protein
MSDFGGSQAFGQPSALTADNLVASALGTTDVTSADAIVKKKLSDFLTAQTGGTANGPWDYTQGLADVKTEMERAQGRLLTAGQSPSDILKAQQADQEPWWMGGLKTLGDLGVALDWLFGSAEIRTLLGGGLVHGAEIDKYAEGLGTHAPTGKELLLKWGWMNQEADRQGQIDLIDVLGLGVDMATAPQTWYSLGTLPATEAMLKGGSVALRETSHSILDRKSVV